MHYISITQLDKHLFRSEYELEKVPEKVCICIFVSASARSRLVFALCDENNFFVFKIILFSLLFAQHFNKSSVLRGHCSLAGNAGLCRVFHVFTHENICIFEYEKYSCEPAQVGSAFEKENCVGRLFVLINTRKGSPRLTDGATQSLGSIHAALLCLPKSIHLRQPQRHSKFAIKR